ncbi:hypothetical protein T484DRAFT_1972256, partial [Baffinella frigidus]
TPLHWAAQEGHAAVVEQLLAAGAEKDAEDTVRVETRRCITLRTEATRRWWSSSWRRGRRRTRQMRVDGPRCIGLREEATRRWWSSSWRRGRRWTRQIR